MQAFSKGTFVCVTDMLLAKLIPHLSVICTDVKTDFNFCYNLVFSVMFGLKHFHSGIRGGNSDYAFVGRQKTTHVMFFNKHDIYCSFLYNDMKVHVLAPPPVEYYLKNNEAFFRIRNPFREKEGNYITETEYKHLKNNLCSGMPTF